MSGKTRDNTFNLSINGIYLNEVNSVKYLGVHIDNKLSWKKHVANLCSKVAKGSWALTKLRKYVNHKTLLSISYEMIFTKPI